MQADDRGAALEAKIVALETRIAELVDVVAARDARIAELDRLLEEARRSGKRQSAPFSKGEPKDEPARPGRKKGKGHGRHGRRMPPVAEPDRTLEAPAPEVRELRHGAGVPARPRAATRRRTPPRAGRGRAWMVL